MERSCLWVSLHDDHSHKALCCWNHCLMKCNCNCKLFFRLTNRSRCNHHPCCRPLLHRHDERLSRRSPTEISSAIMMLPRKERTPLTICVLVYWARNSIKRVIYLKYSKWLFEMLLIVLQTIHSSPMRFQVPFVLGIGSGIDIGHRLWVEILIHIYKRKHTGIW